MRSELTRIGAIAATIVSIFALPQNANAVAPEVLWALDAGNVLDDTVSGVAIAPDGSVYVTGFFAGPTDFGGGPIGIDAIDGFVAKYDADGNHLWSFAIGGDGNDFGIDVALHPAGGIAVTGYFDSPLAEFGGGDFVNLGGTDVFVARYDEDGGHLWSRTDGGTSDEQALGVATSTFGQVVIAGFFTGEVDFGSGPHVSLGDNDVFVARYDSLGVGDGSVAAGGTSSDLATDVAVDAAGNIVAVGHFEGEADFGSGPHVSAGDDDIFAMVIDGVDGEGIWSRAGGGSGQDFGNAVALDANANVLITGSFTGTVNFGGGPLTSAGGADGFLVKLNSDGDHVWSRRFGGLLDDQANAVAVDVAQRVVAGGGFNSDSLFIGPDVVANLGGADAFLVEYTQNGDYICIVSEGSTGDDLFIDLDVTGIDGLVTGGAYSDTLNAGGTELVSTGLLDGFVVRYGPPLVAVPGSVSGPGGIAIDAAWPNPFRSRVTIDFTVDRGTDHAAIWILDVSGRRVRRLDAGSSGRVTWDGYDARGRRVAPGVYFATLEADAASAARRITVIR